MDSLFTLTDSEWQALVSAFFVSARLAFFSSLILLLVCTPLAWFLARRNDYLKYLLQTVFCLPLVLPPSVLGFYLLVLFSPDALIGELWYQISSQQLLFSFEALLLASIVYSLPFVLQPLLSGFEQIEESVLDLARTLGTSKSRCFFQIVLPLNRNAYMIAFALGFAHTLGEFGVVLFVGGNVFEETRVISIAIYEQVELMNYKLAHVMALLVLCVSLVLLLPVYALNGNLLKLSGGSRHGRR